MKLMKLIFLGCFIIFINGCVPSQNIGITYQTYTTNEFENYVNTVEEKLNLCYKYILQEDDNIFKKFEIPKYTIREDYYEPRYVKLKLFYHRSPIPYGVFYFIKNENNTDIIIRERDEGRTLIENPKLKNWIKNNMECKR